MKFITKNLYILLCICVFMNILIPTIESKQKNISDNIQMNTTRWSPEKAREWYNKQPWLCGFNFLPSTAINSTEMWQLETFDPGTIDSELGWAHDLGFNSCRVFLQYIVWKQNPDSLKQRIDLFLKIASKLHISVMFCLFDDCAHTGKQPYLGKQDAPAPGIHNSGWTPSPGHERVTDCREWTTLEKYVKDIVGRFSQDKRIVAWDLYNEPGASGMGNKSLPLLEASFAWARSVNPIQPLTTGIWTPKLQELSKRTLELSDVINFHNYDSLAYLIKEIADLKKYNRPVICTEWMRRPVSIFETHLPVFKNENVGCYIWGLVNGKMQTHFPWGSPKGAPEPKLWFHDLLRKDGTPFSKEEVEVIIKYTGGEK